ncbi:MAG: DUF5313 family protein [Frankia sp.]|nr:DUF5313 family protein [Frankia sp.]
MDVGKEPAAAGTPAAEAQPAAAPKTSTGAPTTTPQAPAAAADATPAAAGPAAPAAPVAPPLSGRILYLFGGTLPTRYTEWVSRDLTGPGWRRRQSLRPVLMMLPFAIVFALLPGQLGIRMMLVGFLLIASLGIGVATSGHFRNRRLVQHGFPPVFPEEEDEGDDAWPPTATAPTRGGAAHPAAAERPRGDDADPDDPAGFNA